MTIQQFLIALSSISIFTVIKLFFLLALVLYFAFSLIVVRQVEILVNTFKTGFETILKIIAWIQLGLVVVIFLIVLFFV
jgi:hypothetical protein